MTKTSETIVFFGSGPVAARSLELLAQHTAVEAVVTKPQPAHHKQPFPVVETAQALGLTILTANTRDKLSTLFSQKPVTSQLAVLIDYGIIVGQDIIDYFPLGIINSHFSVLPDLRGADPITYAILSGQDMTGVSLMLLVAAMDEGSLISYGEQPLDGSETVTSLTERLILLSDALLQDGLPRYRTRQQTVPQSTSGRTLSYSHKLAKADGQIDWHKSAVQLEREIRAYLEWPKSYTNLAGKDIIITKAHATPDQPKGSQPGDVSITPNLAITCGQGSLIIEHLKPSGKADMTAQAFLAGYGQALR